MITSVEAAATVIEYFCKGCGYSLRGLASPRCPECGREFDASNPRTMSRRPRSAARRIWLRRFLVAFPLMLMAGYVGTYLKLVEVVPPPLRVIGMSFGSQVKLSTPPPPSPPRPPQPYLNLRPLGSLKEVYTSGGDWTHRFFFPANWLDRWIRMDKWTDYGWPVHFTPAMKLVHQAQVQNRSILAKAREVNGTIEATNMLKPTSVLWAEWDKEVWKRAAELRAALDDWKSRGRPIDADLPPPPSKK